MYFMVHNYDKFPALLNTTYTAHERPNKDVKLPDNTSDR